MRIRRHATAGANSTEPQVRRLLGCSDRGAPIGSREHDLGFRVLIGEAGQNPCWSSTPIERKSHGVDHNRIWRSKSLALERWGDTLDVGKPILHCGGSIRHTGHLGIDSPKPRLTALIEAYDLLSDPVHVHHVGMLQGDE